MKSIILFLTFIGITVPAFSSEFRISSRWKYILFVEVQCKDGSTFDCTRIGAGGFRDYTTFRDCYATKITFFEDTSTKRQCDSSTEWKSKSNTGYTDLKVTKSGNIKKVKE